MKNIALLIMNAIFCNILLAQHIPQHENLVLKQKKLNITSTPFANIEILDNRIDTERVFNYENGIFPPSYLYLDKSAVKNYFENAIMNISNGDETLLINLSQLRIANKSYVIKNGIKHPLIAHNLRMYIQFQAEIFIKKSDNEYKKLLTVNKEYYSFGLYEKILPGIFNDVIEMVSSINEFANAEKATNNKTLLKFLQDSTAFLNISDSIKYTRERICKESNKWAEYPIIKQTVYSNGAYLSFDDFQNSISSPTDISLQFDEKDSVYKAFGETNKKSSFLWPAFISYDNELYAYLFNNVYLKMYKSKNTFYFYVPRNLPNMYMIFSIEEIKHEDSYYSSSGISNIWVALIGLASSATIESLTKNPKQKQILENSLKPDFRSCFIEMSSGDIIYD
ncbi:MAG TPA: hypothetical protein PLP23_15135 [Panacibacter sp.]|nr:hypothetical protein [Panacibacter sp.]